MKPNSTSDTALTAEPDEQEIVVTRVLDAPREPTSGEVEQ